MRLGDLTLAARRLSFDAVLMGWTPADGMCCESGGVDQPLEETSVGQASTIGLEIAKRVFQAHGTDASGHALFRKSLVRAKLLEFFAAQPPCTAGDGGLRRGASLGSLRA